MTSVRTQVLVPALLRLEAPRGAVWAAAAAAWLCRAARVGRDKELAWNA